MAELLTPSDLFGRVRRDLDRGLLRARNGVKHLSGVGRPGVGLSPKETIWERDKAQLWRYAGDERRLRPPILLVMSLVSRSYILDLRPGNSFIEVLLGRGLDVFLADWGVPDELEAANTLETYTDVMLPEIVAEVAKAAQVDDVTVFGYCFGGLLALLYAAGHADAPIRNLVAMATPIDFAQMGPMASLLQEGRLDPADLVDDTGNVPPDVIYNSFRVLKPTGDLASYTNLWQNLWNDEFVEGYEALTQWTRDHIPFPGACFAQTVELLARGNQLASGRMTLGGREVDLGTITWPFLNVIAEKDHIVPPAAVGRLSSLVGSADVTELRLPSGHVGLVTGRSAQKRTIPAIADWLEAHSDEI
jgi:polyhydroxyalkanoate synthase subunit PhaC